MYSSVIADTTAMREIPATSQESGAFRNDLKHRGFSFVGSTVYAHMQAVGMVNDHRVACFGSGLIVCCWLLWLRPRLPGLNFLLKDSQRFL
jgi:hypothetical protein